MPELYSHRIPEKDLRKRAKYLRKCKQAMWNRWTREYIRSLREQHRLTEKKDTSYPNVGDRNVWKLAMVKQLITGRDSVVRAVRLKTGNGHLERAIQHLFPLELSCDAEEPSQLNPEAPEYNPRPRRQAAAVASQRIQEIVRQENEEH